MNLSRIRYGIAAAGLTLGLGLGSAFQAAGQGALAAAESSGGGGGTVTVERQTTEDGATIEIEVRRESGRPMVWTAPANAWTGSPFIVTEGSMSTPGSSRFVWAQAQNDPTQPFFFISEDAEAAEPIVTAFLGVVTAPLPEPVRAQTDLGEGIGLMVEHVQPESPAAAAGLVRHDILHKLNDQILVNPDQLRTLIRAAGAGAEVSLTVVRKGQPVTVKATLTEQTIQPERRTGFRTFTGPEAREMINRQMEAARRAAEAARDRIGEMEIDKKLESAKETLKERSAQLREYLKEKAGEIDREKLEQWAEEIDEQVRQLDERLGEKAGEWRRSGLRWLEERGLLDGDEGGDADTLVRKLGDGGEAQVHARATYKDETHAIELEMTDGQRHFTVKDVATGKVIAAGKLDGDHAEALEALDPEVRRKLEMLTKQVQVKVESKAAPVAPTDGDDAEQQ